MDLNSDMQRYCYLYDSSNLHKLEDIVSQKYSNLFISKQWLANCTLHFVLMTLNTARVLIRKDTLGNLIFLMSQTIAILEAWIELSKKSKIQMIYLMNLLIILNHHKAQVSFNIKNVTGRKKIVL